MKTISRHGTRSIRRHQTNIKNKKTKTNKGKSGLRFHKKTLKGGGNTKKVKYETLDQPPFFDSILLTIKHSSPKNQPLVFTKWQLMNEPGIRIKRRLKEHNLKQEVLYFKFNKYKSDVIEFIDDIHSTQKKLEVSNNYMYYILFDLCFSQTNKLEPQQTCFRDIFLTIISDYAKDNTIEYEKSIFTPKFKMQFQKFIEEQIKNIQSIKTENNFENTNQFNEEILGILQELLIIIGSVNTGMNESSSSPKSRNTGLGSDEDVGYLTILPSGNTSDMAKCYNISSNYIYDLFHLFNATEIGTKKDVETERILLNANELIKSQNLNLNETAKNGILNYSIILKNHAVAYFNYDENMQIKILSYNENTKELQVLLDSKDLHDEISNKNIKMTSSKSRLEIRNVLGYDNERIIIVHLNGHELVRLEQPATESIIILSNKECNNNFCDTQIFDDILDKWKCGKLKREECDKFRKELQFRKTHGNDLSTDDKDSIKQQTERLINKNHTFNIIGIDTAPS